MEKSYLLIKQFFRPTKIEMSFPPDCNQCNPQEVCCPPPSACRNLVGLTSKPGATLLSTLYVLEESDTKSTRARNTLPKGTTTSLVANVISYGFVMAAIECKQAFLVDQTLSLNCDNSELGELVANNKNCTLCKDVVSQIINDRKKLEKEAMGLNNGFIPTPIAERVLNVVNGNLDTKDDGLCQYMCMQCVARNVNQNITIRLSQDCSVTDSDFIRSFATGMSHQAEQEVNKHQKTLNAAGYNINTTQDVKTLAVQLRDSIVDITTDCSLHSLRTSALLAQTLVVRSGSTSVVIENSSQSISLAMFSSITSDIFTETYIKNGVRYSDLESSIREQTNFKDLLIEAEATVKTIGNLLESTIGKILITILAMVLLGIVVFSAVFYFRPAIIFGEVDGDYDITT